MDIDKILEDHQLWLQDSPLGKKADLSYCDLRGADLRGANLVDADLSGSNVFETDLQGAYLNDVKNKFILTFQIGKNFGYYCDGHITIGCKTHSVEKWLEDGPEIGKREGYQDSEIVNYMRTIQFIKDEFHKK